MEDTPNKSLPFELEVEILIRLPMKSVVRFKCVSKHWLSLITSQSFVNQYLNINGCRDNCFLLIRSSSISDFVYSGDHGIVSRVSMPLRYKIDSERDIIGSSNGLLCFNNPSNACISVYNPITRDHKAVPYSRLASNIRTSGLQVLLDGRKIGFGYDHKSNGFKILLLLDKDNLSYIYRLQNDSYEKIKHSSVFNWHYSDFIVYSNNALHKKFWRSVPNNGHSKGIAAFDLGTEQFYEVELPRRISSYTDWNMTDLRGLLHLVTYGGVRVSRGVQACLGVDVWVMNEYGVKSSWTQLLRCSYDNAMILFRRESTWRQLQIYAYSDDQRSVLIGFGRFNEMFYSCDLRTKAVNKLGFPTNCTNFHNGWIDRLHFAPWSPSFVSP